MHAHSDQDETLTAFRKRAAFLARTLLSPWPAVDASTARRRRASHGGGRRCEKKAASFCACSGQAVNRVSGRIKQGQSPRTIRIKGQ